MKYVKAFESKRLLTETQIEEATDTIENLVKITGSMPDDVYFTMSNPPSKFKDVKIVYNPNGVFLPGHGRVQETINVEHKDGYSWLTCSSYRMVGNLVKLAMMFDGTVDASQRRSLIRNNAMQQALEIAANDAGLIRIINTVVKKQLGV